MDSSRKAHHQQQQKSPGIQSHWVLGTPAEPIAAESRGATVPPETPCQASSSSGSKGSTDRMRGPDTGEPKPTTAPLNGVRRCRNAGASSVVPIGTNAQMVMQYTRLLACMDSRASHWTAGARPHYGLPGFLPSPSKNNNSSPKRTAGTGRVPMSPPLAPLTPCKDKRLQDCRPHEAISSVVEGSVEKRSREEISMMELTEDDPMDSCSGHGLTKPEAPVTPDQSKRMQDCSPRDVIDLDEETLTEGGDMQRGEIRQPPLEEQTTGLPSPSERFSRVPSQQEELEPQDDTSAERAASHQQETEEGDSREKQGKNLSRTPRQKIKRKKHRPKVIREGKPAKTPKPPTPNQAAEKKNQIVKRHYVRKNKGPDSSEAPSEANRDTASGAAGTVIRKPRGSKPVMRRLNFDSEDQAPDVREAATPTNGKSQARGSSMGASNASGTKSTMKLPQGLEVVLENTEVGFAFDLNRSLNQVLEEYIRSPVSTTPDWPSTEGLIRDFKQQAKVSDMKEPISDHCSNQLPENPTQLAQPSRIEAIGEILTHGLNIPSGSILTEDGIEKTQAKRDCSHVDDTQTRYADGAPRDADFVQAYEEINQANKHHEMSRPVLTYKKRRTERVQAPKYNQKVQCTPTYSTLSDLQMERTPEKAEGAEQMLAFDRTKGTKKKRSELRTRVRKPASLATILECNQLSSGYQPQDCMEALNSDLRLKLKTKKRSKKRRVSSMSSNTNQVREVGSCNYKSIKHRSLVLAASTVIRFKLKNAYHRRNSSIQDCESSSSIQASLRASTWSREIVRYVDPIDDIVQKLKCLNISGAQVDTAARGHCALIPYGGGGMMVPHKGPPRKRRPRAKVDLDPETNRVWKLLMGKEAHDEADRSEMDKEKWWEEQRLVFNGRVKSFIARMHLVQGDRRFSQWKGSVVDSVVGVFLTQNVSDNLSSSAFMSLAARFPVQSGSNNREPNATRMNMSTPQGNGSIFPDDDTIKWEEEILGPEVFDQGSIITHEDELMQEKDVASSDISLGSHTGGLVDYIEGKGLHAHGKELQKDSEAPEIRTNTITGSTSSPETEDRRTMEDVVSSQISVFSSENSLDYLIQAADQVGSSSERNSEADLIIGRKCSGSDSCTSWVEFIDIEENTRTQKPNNHDAGRVSSTESCNAIAQRECTEVKERKIELDGAENVNSACSSIYTTDSHLNHAEHNFRGLLSVPSMWTYSHVSSFTELLQMEKDVVREEIGSDLSLAASEVTYVNNVSSLTRTEATCQEKLTAATNAQALDSHASMCKISQKLLSCSETDVCLEKPSFCHNIPSDRIGTSSSHEFSQFQDEHGAKFQQEERKADFQVENTQHAVDNLVQMQQSEMQNTCSNSCEISEVVEAVESNTKNDVSSSQKDLQELEKNTSRTKRVKAETGKKTIDWDNLRKEACCYGAEMKRNNERLDSLDWEAVRTADVDEISQAIRGRGMNNVLAERIKNFLDRLVRDHGSIDLEWLRNAAPDKAKEYLLSIRGLGLKSVECVRLLTLNNHAFPVDTNVGRICVRLGWVPLQPLPESLQLHLLELYPVMETIQKYLWPRLCRLDQQTLYELHYQMITFGKVFCRKRRPNCNACPMRGECRHFASEFASARLALPGPESHRDPVVNTIPLPQLEGGQIVRNGTVFNNCEPIIEEPATPEPECLTNLGSDMEDFYFEDPNEIPQIEVNLKGLTQNLLSLMQENNMELQDGDLSKAIVAITTEAASIPMPKLKNVTRLRTEHQVYELPDSHPLLESLDRREPDDPCPYLLAIWTPGETARSTEPPETCCTSQDTGKLCYNRACFACNSTREAQAQTVRGTLLIPCRTAMRGSFPLNGTYFQVNEVFADHGSSCEPIYVPREWIWNLPRRTVYFGTSVPTIFRGLTTESIQHCFWRGYVCVRGFDRTTRGPRPLKERLHCSAYRAFKNKKAPAEED